jgi:hypothetical protein
MGLCLECHTVLHNTDYPNHNNQGLSHFDPPSTETAPVGVTAVVYSK